MSPPTDVARNGVELGEVVFSGNICARGYHKDPVATAKLALPFLVKSAYILHRVRNQKMPRLSFM